MSVVNWSNCFCEKIVGMICIGADGGGGVPPPHVISIVASLMKNCRGPQRQRLLSKFTENDHEKVERLMEMHFKFLEKVTETEQEIARAGMS